MYRPTNIELVVDKNELTAGDVIKIASYELELDEVGRYQVLWKNGFADNVYPYSDLLWGTLKAENIYVGPAETEIKIKPIK